MMINMWQYDEAHIFFRKELKTCSQIKKYPL